MKKFNVQPTLEAFEVVRPKMKDLLTLRVHEALLLGHFLNKYNNYLRKTLGKLEVTSNDVLLASFIGKLAVRMPLVVEGKWDDFQKQQQKFLAASLLINILVDSGEYVLEERIKEVDPSSNYGKPYRKDLFLIFDGVEPKKELLRGLETRSGVYYQDKVGSIKLSAEFKGVLHDVGSMAFKLSDVASEELILHGYKLSKNYVSSGDGRGEDPTLKRERYKSYAALIMNDVAALDKFYLPMKYDSRSRMYYEFQLEGMRPQGHLWETLMIDAYEPQILSRSAVNHLKHIIYVTRYGRCSLDQALYGWTNSDWVWANNRDPLKATTEKEFGEFILVNKAVQAVADAVDGTPSHYMFGKDLTNSGLMMAGSCFKSAKMLKMANLIQLKTVHDSHTDMQKSYGLDHLTRKDMKKISNPMLHGASIGSMVKNVQLALRENGESDDTVDTITKDFVIGKNHEAFGLEVDNIFTISSWGASAVSNTQTELYWTTPDGFKAYHRAHMKYCPVVIHTATASVKACFRETKLVSDMPLKQQANGRPLHDKSFIANGSKHAVEVSKTGLHANLTHSFDATLLRRVVNRVVSKGEVCLLKHDDYMVFPDMYDDIIEIGQVFFKEAASVNFYEVAMKDIASNGSTPPIPDLVIGDCEVEDSVNYLMP